MVEDRLCNVYNYQLQIFKIYNDENETVNWTNSNFPQNFNNRLNCVQIFDTLRLLIENNFGWKLYPSAEEWQGFHSKKRGSGKWIFSSM